LHNSSHIFSSVHILLVVQCMISLYTSGQVTC
jgi:hypothetical protein